MTVRVETVNAIPLAVVQRQVQQSELTRVVPECCGIVWNALKAQGIKGGRNVAMYWDGSIRLEVGVELNVAFAERDGLVKSATPAGRVAHATHFGPYGTMGNTHRAIHEYLRANGLQSSGKSWETYGHWEDSWNADPSKIRTDIYYLLA